MIHTSKTKRDSTFFFNLKALTTTNFIFLISTVLPLVMLYSFNYGIFETGPKLKVDGNDVSTGIAKIITPDGTGTAFLISKNQLITCKHVVDGQQGQTVELRFVKQGNSQKFGKVSFLSKNYDYAVIELTEPVDDSYFVMKTESAEGLQLNQEVAAIGYPQGSFASSIGHVSNTEYEGDVNLIQMWLGAWFGSSGSPVFNPQTKNVYGIITSGKEVPNMVFALKIDAIKEDLDQNKIVNDLQ
jgi:S1-C subfamily serine protease